MSTDLWIAEQTALQMESKAEWRQRKAEQWPDDRDRNLACADQFLEMAERLRAFKGGPWYDRLVLRYQHAGSDMGLMMEEVLQTETESIHFVAMEPEELFKRLVEGSTREADEADAPVPFRR